MLVGLRVATRSSACLHESSSSIPVRPRDAAKPIDDFEWPPTADDLSVYEMGPDPWQTRQDASSPVFAARRVSCRSRPEAGAGTGA